MNFKIIIQLLLIMIVLGTFGCSSEHMPLPENLDGLDQQGEQLPQEPPVEELLFERDILPIVEKRCALCHTGGGLPDWRIYDVIFEKRELVRKRVFEFRDMPQGNATNITDQERALINEWVMSGAL